MASCHQVIDLTLTRYPVVTCREPVLRLQMRWPGSVFIPKGTWTWPHRCCFDTCHSHREQDRFLLGGKENLPLSIKPLTTHTHRLQEMGLCAAATWSTLNQIPTPSPLHCLDPSSRLSPVTTAPCYLQPFSSSSPPGNIISEHLRRWEETEGKWRCAGTGFQFHRKSHCLATGRDKSESVPLWEKYRCLCC